MSHNNIANDKIITTIEDIEKGINTEIKSVNKEISTENVATRQLIRQKAKKQEEFIQKQLDSDAKEQKMMEDIEEEFEELEKEDKEIEEEFENQEIEEIKAEFENQEKETK